MTHTETPPHQSGHHSQTWRRQRMIWGNVQTLYYKAYMCNGNTVDINHDLYVVFWMLPGTTWKTTYLISIFSGGMVASQNIVVVFVFVRSCLITLEGWSELCICISWSGHVSSLWQHTWSQYPLEGWLLHRTLSLFLPSFCLLITNLIWNYLISMSSGGMVALTLTWSRYPLEGWSLWQHTWSRYPLEEWLHSLLPDLDILWRNDRLTELHISHPLPHFEGSFKRLSEDLSLFWHVG